jgi:hypothetical protein
MVSTWKKKKQIWLVKDFNATTTSQRIPWHGKSQMALGEILLFFEV